MIAYNLVIDNKRIADETAKLQIRDFYLASSPPADSFMVRYGDQASHQSPVKAHPEKMPEMQNVTPRYLMIITYILQIIIVHPKRQTNVLTTRNKKM